MDNVSYEVIDIQDIPYEDGFFDVVIANYMLCHVPDIARALSEVSRVLKCGGCFYAGITGENGIMETVMKYLKIKALRNWKSDLISFLFAKCRFECRFKCRFE